MTRVSVSDLSHGLNALLERLERDGETIVVVRDNHPIARIVPELPRRDALEVMNNLYGIITPEAAEHWVEVGKLRRTLDQETRDPWAS